MLAAGPLPPYAVKYQDKGGVLPWKALLIDGYDNAPWLPFLPPEANWTLYGLGRYFLSQTPACKRGTLKLDQYGPWVRDIMVCSERTSAADTLMKHCAAFAYSPLSIVIDIRAAVQCISLATKRALSGRAVSITIPSLIEGELDHVCAGCGVEHRDRFAYLPPFGHTLKYCSEECAYTVSHASICIHCVSMLASLVIMSAWAGLLAVSASAVHCFVYC